MPYINVRLPFSFNDIDYSGFRVYYENLIKPITYEPFIFDVECFYSLTNDVILVNDIPEKTLYKLIDLTVTFIKSQPV